MINAHIDVFMNNIARHLAMPAEGEPGRIAHIIILVVWLSVCGLMLVGCLYGLIHAIRHPPKGMFGPIPGHRPIERSNDGN